MKCIKIKNIVKAFQEKTVLKDISLTIEKGEIFGLLGPSGAGKTTLIKILTGQLKADKGTADLLGMKCNQLDKKDYTKIGMVLDNSGLYERLSCYDNLKIFTKIYGLQASKIKEVLEHVGLQEATKTVTGKLSKGMRQRLVLARAIIHEPELLFLDEPTSGLDPATAKNIHELLFELKEKGTTIFLTTHNMEEAAKLCDHIALLNEGVIVEYGVPDEICRKYNVENIITILCKDGKLITLQNSKTNAGQIAEVFEHDNVEAIHSSEPNLETVFMSLTGRRLQ